MGTFSQKPALVEKKWIIIDAEDVVLGRMASIVASRLRGKHKVTFTPHVDDGDNVIIINAAKVKLTGKKYEDKVYYWHTVIPAVSKSVQQKPSSKGNSLSVLCKSYSAHDAWRTIVKQTTG